MRSTISLKERAIEHYWLTLLLFILITAFLAYQNTQVRRGGVLDNAITDKSLPEYKEDQHTAHLFPSTEHLIFVYQHPLKTQEDFWAISRLSEALQKFPWARGRVWSLSTIPNFRKEGDILLTDPFIPFDAHKLDPKKIKEDIRNNEAVYGKLVAKDFSYALVVVFLPREHSEEEVYWNCINLLEEGSSGSSIYQDVQFISQVAKFKREIEGLKETGAVISLISILSQLSRVLYQKSLPQTPLELADCFVLVENSSFASDIRSSFYFYQEAVPPHYGVRLLVNTKVVGDSIKLKEFCDRLKELAQGRFPDLVVHRGGKTFLWPAQDRLIRYGKLWNVFISTGWVILICVINIWLVNYRKKYTHMISPVYGGIIMAIPLTFATAVMALWLIFSRTPLDQANAVIMAMAVGISIDFSIYWMSAYQENLDQAGDWQAASWIATQSSGKLVTSDALVNSLGLFPLYFSRFGPVSALGILAPVMVSLCALGALVVLPCMVALPHWIKGDKASRKGIVCIGIISLGLFAFFPKAQADELGEKIMHEGIKRQLRAPVSYSCVQMVTEGGGVGRSFRIQRLFKRGVMYLKERDHLVQSVVLDMEEPPDRRGIRYLVRCSDDGSKEELVYLKSERRPRRISHSDLDWVESSTYQFYDLAEHIDDYQYRLLTEVYVD